VSIKLRIMDVIKAEGYDFVTAGELANEAIKRLMESDRKEMTFCIGRSEFTLQKKETGA
jgi:hypothetical protein